VLPLDLFPALCANKKAPRHLETRCRGQASWNLVCFAYPVCGAKILGKWGFRNAEERTMIRNISRLYQFRIPQSHIQISSHSMWRARMSNPEKILKFNQLHKSISFLITEPFYNSLCQNTDLLSMTFCISPTRRTTTPARPCRAFSIRGRADSPGQLKQGHYSFATKETVLSTVNPKDYRQIYMESA